MLQLFELNRVLLNFIAKAPKVPEWVEIHALADKAEPVIESLFMDSILRLKMQMDLNKVSEAFTTNSIGEVEKTIPWEVFDIKFAEIQEIIYNLLVGGGSIAALEFWQQTGRFMKADDDGPSMEFSFNVRSPHAIKWAADHSSELIREVSDETRAGVRSIISEAFTSGGHPYETARQIREMVGLTDRQMGSVRSLRERLRAAKATDIDKKVERYTKKRINQRAKLIARTETIRSACEGQQTHWNDMIQKGYLDKDEMVKEWIVTPDDRLCARCNELDGKQAPIDGEFTEMTIAKSTMTDLPHPPLHPGCRCAIGLVKKEGVGQVDDEEEWEAEEGLVEPEFDFEKYRVMSNPEGVEWSKETDLGFEPDERDAAKKYFGVGTYSYINSGMRDGSFEALSNKVKASGIKSLDKAELRRYDLRNTAKTLESMVDKSELPDNLSLVRHGGNNEALAYLRGTGASEEDLEFLKTFNPLASKEELDPLVATLNPKIKGAVFQPTQFISTSFDPAGSQYFSYMPFKYEIYADKGSQGMISNKLTASGKRVNESEIIFGPSSKMEIMGARVDNYINPSKTQERGIITIMMHLTRGGG